MNSPKTTKVKTINVGRACGVFIYKDEWRNGDVEFTVESKVRGHGNIAVALADTLPAARSKAASAVKQLRRRATCR